MEPTQVKQLFINLFGESLDIYGLSVKLISVEWFRTTKLSNNYGFDFEITNPKYDANGEILVDKYRYKLDLIDEGWITYITKKLDGKDMKNLYLP